MIRNIIFMVLMLLPASLSSGWASDCAQFMDDFQKGKIVSSKAYQFESDQLYLPAGYCPFPPMNFVSNEKNHAELSIIEQCRETGYKLLRTTLQCLEAAKAAKIRASCDVEGHLLSPCLKPELAEVLMAKEAA